MYGVVYVSLERGIFLPQVYKAIDMYSICIFFCSRMILQYFYQTYQALNFHLTLWNQIKAIISAIFSFQSSQYFYTQPFFGSERFISSISIILIENNNRMNRIGYFGTFLNKTASYYHHCYTKISIISSCDEFSWNNRNSTKPPNGNSTGSISTMEHHVL